MSLTNKEQIQEIKDALDERLIFDYLYASTEIKLALLAGGLAEPDNIDEILKELMEFESTALRDKRDEDKLGV